MLYSLIGGSGSVGQELVPILLKSGHKVRVLGRNADQIRTRFGEGVECVSQDLTDVRQSAEVLKDSDVVIYLVGVPYTQFALHPELMRSALDSAIAAKVPYFIHVSTVYPYGLPQTSTVAETHPREPRTFKGRMRKEQEDLVFQAQASSRMKCMVVRPSDFYGPTAENSYVRDIFVAALKNRRANVVGPVSTPHDFIFLPDLAAAIVRLSELPSAFGKAYNITGPEPLTTQQFADLVFGEVGRPAKLTAAGKSLLWVAGWFSPMMGEVFEMHYLWTSPVLLDDSQLLRTLPNFSKTPHKEAIRATLTQMRKDQAA